MFSMGCNFVRSTRGSFNFNPLGLIPHSLLLLDTQDYTFRAPEVFMRQTQWIAENKVARNIRLVLHLGDITDKNTRPHWMNARRAMDILVRAKIPFSLVPGNHDVGIWGSCNDRRTLLNEYFGAFDYEGSFKDCGYYQKGRMENTWQTIDTPWGPVLIIALEYLPRDPVVAWAGQVVRRFPDHHAILVTHSYLSPKGQRIDWHGGGIPPKTVSKKGYVTDDPEGYNDGELLWRKLVSKHKNFVFTFNGHVIGTGTSYLKSTGEQGNEVHQMMVNYQTGVKPYPGMGFLRILEFHPDKKTIKTSSYSPYLDKLLPTADLSIAINWKELKD
jgi:hypothetical protein